MATGLIEQVMLSFDQNHWNYHYNDEEKRLNISFNLENMSSVSMSLFFDDDNESLAIRAFNLCKVNENKKFKMYQACSQLNDAYRWVKFYIDDEDNTVTASLDTVIREKYAGEVSIELVGRMAAIIDDAYPKLMKALWS